jgi:hypothetical protein
MNNSNLVEVKKTPNETLIEYLESMLETAKTGEIVGMAMAIRYQDGSTGNGFVQGPAGIALIGELELL